MTNTFPKPCGFDFSPDERNLELKRTDEGIGRRFHTMASTGKELFEAAQHRQPQGSSL